jgi:hypothetical protein
MKRETLKFEIERPKRRAKELFDREYNYGPKTVERKDSYKRRPKFKQRYIDEEMGND